MFRVFWHPDALSDLARVWTDADDSERQAITAAAREVDRLLTNSPETVGESREGTERITFVDQLGLVYDVYAQHRLVRIDQVWHLRRHR